MFVKQVSNNKIIMLVESATRKEKIAAGKELL